MSLVVTELEANVAPDRADELQRAYADAARGPFPSGLVSSRLLRGTADATRWRIQTVWQSLDHLTAMRAAGKPRGVQMFEAAGAPPSLSIFEVIAELAPPGGAA